MKKNTGTIDRIVRLVLAFVIAALYFLHVITGTLGIILLALAVIFVITSVFSFCPIWWSLKISTLKKKDA